MTSSVDPTTEIVALLVRLNALGEPTYEGIADDFVLPVDGFGKTLPYRDIQPGSMIPAAGQRLLAAHEQAQPYVWAFQIAHVGPTRKAASDLAIETDKSLIGWEPSDNAGPVGTFFFTVYDEFAKQGETKKWIATRFYETTLGQNPDLNAITVPNLPDPTEPGESTNLGEVIVQATPSAFWSFPVSPDLGRAPAVQVRDETGEVVYADVHSSPTLVIVQFPTARTGSVILN